MASRKEILSTIWRGGAIETAGKDINEILSEAKLDWEIKTSPFRYGENYQHLEFNNQIAYRSDTGAFMSVYKNREPWQNRDILENFFNFAKEGGLEVGYVGSLGQDQAEVFAAVELEGYTIKGDSEEQHQTWMLLRDGHRNGTGLKVGLFEVRMICTNGMHRTLRHSQKIVNHVGEFKAETVKTMVGEALSFAKKDKEIHEALAETPMTPEEATLQLIQAFGMPGEKVEDQPKLVKTCLDLFMGQAQGGHTMAAYRTAYGLLQSVTEYFNWHVTTRNPANSLNKLLNQSNTKMLGFEKQLVSCYANF